MRTHRNGMNIFLTIGLILGIHRGYIALWHENAVDPCKVFPYKAELLPEQEQERLKDGIQIRDKEHLYELLMNYLS